MTMIWRPLHPQADIEALGYLPGFLDDTDPDPAARQIDKNYRHGGGWQPFPGFRPASDFMSIAYPGDPPYPATFEAWLRDERIIVYTFSWVAIVQPDDSFEIARID